MYGLGLGLGFWGLRFRVSVLRFRDERVRVEGY